MTRTSAQALAIARPVIKGLIILNVIYALLIAALLIWSFFIEGWPQRPLGFDRVNAHPQVGNGLRAIILLGLIAAAVVHTVLRRLLAIVDTVRSGDPFILENAQRLNAIAWSVAALEGLRLVIDAQKERSQRQETESREAEVRAELDAVKAQLQAMRTALKGLNI